MPNRKPIAVEDIPAKSGCGYPKSFHPRMGVAAWRELGDHFGLTQFGVSHETLAPGAESSVPGDTAFYSDDDLAIFNSEAGRVWVHKDGRRY